MSELITWRGTPGVGDFMWALNCAHNYAYRFVSGRKVTLEFHWEHGPRYLHHIEDPETIIERLEYIHNFYHRKDDVQVEHVFKARGRYKDIRYEDDLRRLENGRLRVTTPDRKGRHKPRFWFQSDYYNDTKGSALPDSDWGFRDDAFKPMDKRKVVVWRPTFNAEIPRKWKNELTNEQWDDIISSLGAAGLYTVELTYRTPISEVIYHISTCRQVVCYDGMWHYIARNFFKPIMIPSKEGISYYHTPHYHQLPFNFNEIIDKELKTYLGASKRKAIRYEEKCRHIYQD